MQGPKFLLPHKKNVILLKEREKERKRNKREEESGGPIEEKERKKKFSLVNRSHDFQLIYKKITKNVTWKLKIGIVSFQNTYFKHQKLRIVIQTLLIK